MYKVKKVGRRRNEKREKGERGKREEVVIRRVGRRIKRDGWG